MGAAAGVALVALGMVLTPGPNMMYLVSRSISQGRRAGMISLGGVAAGFLVYLTLASAGLSVVFATVPALYITVKLAGAAYLAYLAWQAVRPGGTSVFTYQELPRGLDPPAVDDGPDDQPAQPEGRDHVRVADPAVRRPRAPGT